MRFFCNDCGCNNDVLKYSVANKDIQKYIPLSETQLKSPRVGIDLNLPSFISKEEIGVDFKRLLGLMTIAGIEALTIHGEKGATSKASAGVAGRNGQGAGYASRIASMDSVPESGNDIYSDEAAQKAWDPHAYRWIKSLNISLNTSEISQRIIQADGSVRDPKVWAERVDAEVRKNIRKAGSSHQLTLIFPEIILNGSVAINTLLNTVAMDASISPIEKIAKIALMYYSIYIDSAVLIIAVSQLNMAIRSRLTGSKTKHPFRLTAFPIGPEIDNLLLLQILSRRPHLFKPLRQDQSHL